MCFTKTNMQTLAALLIILMALIATPLHAGIVDASRTGFVSLQLPDNWYMGEVAGLEFLPSGDLVVFNRGLHPLLIFSKQGQFKREIGQGLFRVPHGLFVDSQGAIWTTDQETHQVLKMDQQGQILLILGRRDSPGSGWFDNGYQLNLLNAPSDVALDSQGNIYVADGGNFRIVKFSPEGNLLSSWGSKGEATGQFNFPHSLLFDEQDQLYVTDRQNGRIQIFTTDGQFIKQWQDIGYPYELERFDANTLILTDARSGEINKIGPNGQVLERFGRWGKGTSEFGFPHGLAVDKQGVVYVGELLNWRIQTFK
ncbi:peptidyl-alpha-hydroxyglycine alpha-amidating lyase family protein [Bowmanella sp. Y26]|uniref:peptidyl-alpha-hydroxyglycine alpha-amidating lyase family protein n=1 Tax=Bowmanella yangjiangensis TaxID=2811230 RepID=UPI001BDC8999|nr:peptidyl-alpha-hydroxyglycine alpha-amidating lyase family protein [Bowmanella yangjiangensis]MBT1064427.1 peptidyl-alpha-hydroxyglycine alpha-amidating lyase family protein [Bowmanella yangjiangensis]